MKSTGDAPSALLDRSTDRLFMGLLIGLMIAVAVVMRLDSGPPPVDASIEEDTLPGVELSRPGDHRGKTLD